MAPFLNLIFFGILGLLIGSFLNVVILRYRTGRTVMGRSACFACGGTLSWTDLIPVASFVWLKGKCRYCGDKISWQYPAVELLTALIFGAVAWQAGVLVGFESGMDILFNLIIWSLLVVILVYDLRHKIIPDAFVYTFVVLVLIKSLLVSIAGVGFFATLMNLDLWAGPILFLPFFLLWFLSRGRLMGLGDGKLALGIGFLLGLGEGTTALVIGFWVGAIVSVAILLLQKTGLSLFGRKLTMKSEIPFAPFLILGTLIVFLTGWNLF